MTHPGTSNETRQGEAPLSYAMGTRGPWMTLLRCRLCASDCIPAPSARSGVLRSLADSTVNLRPSSPNRQAPRLACKLQLLDQQFLEAVCDPIWFSVRFS